MPEPPATGLNRGPPPRDKGGILLRTHVRSVDPYPPCKPGGHNHHQGAPAAAPPCGTGGPVHLAGQRRWSRRTDRSASQAGRVSRGQPRRRHGKKGTGPARAMPADPAPQSRDRRHHDNTMGGKTLNKTKYLAGIAAATAVSATALLVAPAGAQEISWDMQSTYPGSLTQLGTLGVRIEEQIALVSGGEIEINFQEPGALGPGAGGVLTRSRPVPCRPAGRRRVTGRAANRLWRCSPPCRSGRKPANTWPGTIFGGGKELFEEIYNSYKHPLGDVRHHRAGRASGWFREPIESDRRHGRPEDAVLRPGRPRDGEDGRFHPAAGRRRHLPGAGASGRSTRGISRCPRST